MAGHLCVLPSIRTGTFTPSADLVPGFLYFLTVARCPRSRRQPGQHSDVDAQVPTAGIRDGGCDTRRGRVRLVGDARWFGHASGGGGRCSSRQGRAGRRPTQRCSRSCRAGALQRDTDAGDEHVLPGRLPGLADDRAASAEVRVLVRRGVSLMGSSSSIVRTAKAGRAVDDHGAVSPAGVATVSFRLYRYDTARGCMSMPGASGDRLARTAVRA